ncbi:hypothetical protein GCM10022268_06680 [Sphingomonas cynarae]|uniref:Lipoprotein n=1 Tax=Sphingomonas cynarae TaxID=930197 RepID=A0ABP7D3X6_9SPHN
MIRSMLVASLPLLMLAACGTGGPATEAADNTADNAAAAAPDGGYAARITALSPRLRQGVFLRAIRDAGEECQEVTEEDGIAAIEGKPAWVVTCDRSTRWVITIDKSGTAAVNKVSPSSRAERQPG